MLLIKSKFLKNKKNAWIKKLCFQQKKKYFFSSNHYSFLGYFFLVITFYIVKTFFFKKNTLIRLENFDEIYIFLSIILILVFSMNILHN